LPDPKSLGAEVGQASQTPEVVNAELPPSLPGAIPALPIPEYDLTRSARGKDVVIGDGLNPLLGSSL